MVPILISLSSQTHIPFQLLYNICDKSELHVCGVGVPYGLRIFKKWTNNSCVGRCFNMLRAWIQIASYECNGMVSCGSNLVFRVRSLVI